MDREAWQGYSPYDCKESYTTEVTEQAHKTILDLMLGLNVRIHFTLWYKD